MRLSGRVLVWAGLGAALLVVLAAVAVLALKPSPRALVDSATRRFPQLGRVVARVAPAPSRAQPGPVPTGAQFTIDVGHPVRSINPLIYGVAVAPADALAATGARFNRWGGNPNTRYNWSIGSAWNSARDWFFANYGGAPQSPSSVADVFVALNQSTGVESMLTVPTMGWVARDGDNATRSTNVPDRGGPPLPGAAGAIAGYDPAANRAKTSVPVFATRAAVARPPDGAIYQDDWIRHLVRRFGTAAGGGVRFYAYDNEPDLWSETHTDVHPVQVGYDDLLADFQTYAQAIKAVDPSAQVLGPTLSGWTGYFYSALDRGTDNFRAHADRTAHGGMPLLPWWLDQLRQADAARGYRTLDILDVHYYPQANGVFANASTDEASNRLRLRSTRSLWDRGYVDESWIGEPVYLIPRMHEWIDQYYPGTALAINEWNWGADETVNGALAIADVLGIFGREGVDMAAYWTYPPVGSPGAQAFRVFTNYDGAGGGFGDQSLPVTTSVDPDDVSVFASLDTLTDDVVLVAINKRPEAVIPTTFRLTGHPSGTPAHVYQYAGGPAIKDAGTVPVTNGQIALDLPASSITVLRVPRAA